MSKVHAEQTIGRSGCKTCGEVVEHPLDDGSAYYKHVATHEKHGEVSPKTQGEILADALPAAAVDGA